MGILKDILDIVKDILANSEAIGTKASAGKQYSSLAKRSLEGTLQFPVLVSSSLDWETIQMISRALEKNYASFVQTSLTMSPFMRLKTEKDLSEYIRNFHQNTNVKTDMLDIIGSIRESSLAGVSNISVLTNVSENMYMISLIHEGISGNIFCDNKELLNEVGNELNNEIANNKFVPKFNYKLTGVSETLKKKYNLIEAANIDPTSGSTRATSTVIHELPKEVLKWSQTQKLNELMPTHLTIKIKALSADGKTSVGDIEFVIGIKSTMHPIKTNEMIINTVNACKNKDKIFNFIRWTTGEISFLKDFIFNINEIKDDISSASAGASRWWAALKRRRALSSFKGVISILVPGTKNMLPNTTLVMSMEEINYIKSTYGYDLMAPYFLSKIMGAYFLLGFVVVDNSTQVVHFMFDGQESFQTYGFSSLKKEAASDENFKQMLNIIRRV